MLKHPKEALKRRCRNCCGKKVTEHEKCYNLGSNPYNCIIAEFMQNSTCYGVKKTTLKTIKEECMHCMGYKHGDEFYGINRQEYSRRVRGCTNTECSLYVFRLGKNPNYSEEFREKCRQQIKQNCFNKEV